MTLSVEPKLRVFGRYELLMEMARGGMATLYLARLRGPEQFSKLVVLKRIHEHLAHDTEFIRMFLDEARIAALIQHPNVASVFDLGQQDSMYFLAMEHVLGEDLLTVLRQSTREHKMLSWQHAVRIICDAAAGLHAAHEATDAEGAPLCVVHRDVSPHNILISYTGHVKVIDFGIAYAAERLSQTDTGTVKGKAAYMSPEQVNSEVVDRRSDVFALGILLYEMVCRRRLFREPSDAATLLRVSKAEVPRPKEVRADLPDALERMILTALQRDPGQRYQTAGAFSDDLEQLLISSDSYAGPKQLAALMSDLFAEEIIRKNKKLRDAQQGLFMTAAEPTVPVPESERTPPAGASVTKPGSALTGGSILRRDRRREVWTGGALAGVGLVVLAIVLVRFWAGGGDSKQPPKRALSPRSMSESSTPEHRPKRRRASAAVQRVSLKVTVRPDRAEPTLLHRGRRYRGSVIQLVLPKSDQQERLEVTAPGYRKKHLLVIPRKDAETVVTLVPRRIRRPVLRRRAPPRPVMRAIDYIDSML